MAKRSKKQRKLDRQQIPNREMRVKITQAMLQGNPKEFLVQLYCKAFQIIPGAAINDLKRLGITFTPEEIASLRAAEANAASAPSSTQKGKSIPASPFPLDSDFGQEFGWDETYAFIAGFTSGGAPYGTTWEEVDDVAHNDLPF